jgi:hypothetical protein
LAIIPSIITSALIAEIALTIDKQLTSLVTLELLATLSLELIHEKLSHVKLIVKSFSVNYGDYTKKKGC